MVHRVKIQGRRGSYLAEVEGRKLAVLHQTFYSPPYAYHHPFKNVAFTSPKVQALIEALQDNDLFVLQADADPETLARKGYIGVFRFTDLRVHPEDGLSLRITERYADPKR